MPQGTRQAADSLIYGSVPRTVKFAAISASTSGDNTLVAAVTGKKIRVLNYVLVVASSVIARFESSAGGTALSGQMTLAAGVASAYAPTGVLETAEGELLNLELGGAVQVSGHLSYIEV